MKLVLRKATEEEGATFEYSYAHANGGDGTMDLAKKVIEACEKEGKFEFTYDEDLGEPIADGFYFTYCYPGFTGPELLEAMLYYGVSAISLDTCGSTRQGIRACTSLIQREEIPVLAERLKRFAEDHPIK